MKKFLQLTLLAALLLPMAARSQNYEVYDFEDNAIPAGWTNNSSYPWVVTSTSQGSGHQGTYCIKSGNSGTSSSTSTLSATFEFSGDGSISFLGGIYGEGTSTIYDKCIFKIDGVQQFQYGALATWSTYTYQVNAGTHTFTWEYSKDGSVNPTGDAFFVDNVTVDLGVIPDCWGVKSLAIVGSETTSESITVSWIDTNNSGASYEVFLINGTDTTPEATTTDTFYTFDNLTPSTFYTFGVQANCGSGDPGTMRTVSGRTACATVTIDSDNPYSENFDDGYTACSNDVLAPGNYPDNEMPSCWEFLNLSTSTSSYPQAYLAGSTNYAVSGNCLFFRSSQSTPAYAVMPVFESTEDLQLQFTYRNEGTGTYNGTLSVGYMTDPTDASTYVELRSCQQTTAKTLEELLIPAGTIDTVRLAFRYTGGSSDNYYLAIDNVVLRVAPTCMRVENFTYVDSMTTAHTATFTWQSDASSFQIEYKKAADTTWTEETANDTVYTLTGLDATTTYNVRVKTLCDGEESDYSAVRTFTTTVACPAPTGLRAVLTPGDGTTATITWSDPTGSAWQLCLDGDTNNLIDLTENYLTLDTLTPELPHTAKVRRDCTEEEEGYSDWTATITFTPTDAYSVTVNDGTYTNDYVPVYGLYVDDNIHSQFIIPAADLSAMAFGIINKLTFYASNASVSWGSASFKVYLTETGDTTVSSLNSVADMEEVYSGSLGISGNQMVVNFNTPYQYMGGNLLVAFEQPTSGSYVSCTWYGVSATGASMGGYGSSSVYQRNFLPKMTIDYTPGEEPSCFPISSLAVIDSMTSAESVTITWVDTNNSGASYNIYVITDTDTLPEGTTSDTSYTFEELQANTLYTFGVTTDCGNDVSMIRTIQVRTPCGSVTEFPWSENFDAYAEGTLNIPCWQNEHISGSGTQLFKIYTYATGSNSTYQLQLPDMYSGTQTKLVLPDMEFEEGTAYLFGIDIYRNTTGSPNEGVRVFVSTDGQIEGATELGFLHRNYQQTDGGVVTAETASDWYTYEFRIPDSISGHVNIILRGESSYGSSTYMDNLYVMVAPECLQPAGVSVSDISQTEATIHIDDPEENGNYHLVMLNGTDTVVNETVTDTVITFDTLAAASIYTVHVSAMCDDGTETRSVSTSFRTNCGNITTLPWTEGFEGYAATTSTQADLNCWNTASGNSSSRLYVINDASRVHGGSNSLRFNGNATTPLMAILPPFEDDINTLEMSLWALAESSTSSGVLRVGYVTDATDSSTFVQTALLSAADHTTYALEDVTFAGAPAGARIAIQQINEGQNYWWWVDDINVHLAPSCLRPQEFTWVDSMTTAHTATFTWVGTADSYQFEYKKATDTTWTEVAASDTTVTISGLDAVTGYMARVKGICGNEESQYSATRLFSTTVACPAPANLRAVLTPGDGTVATLVWSDPTGSSWQVCLNGDTNNYIVVNDSTRLNLTGLTPETPYTAKVRRDCTEAAEGYSDWSATITFTPTNAYTITVNDGTYTNSYVPIYGYYVDNNIHSQFIIPAADLSAITGVFINKLTFYSSNANISWNNAVFEVYLTETTATSVNSLNAVSGMTQVYTGSLGISGNQMVVTFTTPYQYMGGNLLVAFEQPTSGSYSSCSWYGVSATGASMGGYGSSSVYQQNFLPKMTIEFLPNDGSVCLPVTNLAVESVTNNSATISWQGNAASYSIYDGTNLLGTTTDTFYTVTGLTGSTAYTFGVVADCSDTSSSVPVTINVLTDCDGGSCTITIVGTDSYGDGWNGGYIDIVQNGVSIAHCAVTDQGLDNTPITETYTYNVCSDSPVSFTWSAGNYDGEVSFIIKNANDSVLYSVSDASTLTSGSVFFSSNDICGGSTPQPTQYTVTLSSANATMGTVSPAGATTVDEGASFSATATANDGYHFVSWTDANGGTVSTANPYTFTVTADVALTATFEANSTPTYYTVTVSSADATMGTVSCTPSGSVEAGTSVTATATPANNHVFTGWVDATGDTVSRANPYTFTVTADVTLVGTFRYDGVGIDEAEVSNVSLFPNPATSTFTVSATGMKEATVIDLNGRTVMTQSAADGTATFDVSTLAKGTYFVRIVGEQATAVRKLVVK